MGGRGTWRGNSGLWDSNGSVLWEEDGAVAARGLACIDEADNDGVTLHSVVSTASRVSTTTACCRVAVHACLSAKFKSGI